MNARLQALLRGVAREIRALPSTARRTSRSLRRAPAFVAIATLSLGAALGLSTSVFALIDSMRHPESPYSNVDQLYTVQLGISFRSGPSRGDFESAIESLRGVAARASGRYQYEQVEFNDGGERRGILYTRGDIFGVLRVRPRIGRLWTEDDRAHGDVAIVSDALWRGRFSNRARVDGATLSVGDNQYRVIAVMPPRTEFAGTMYGQDIWIPDAALDTAGGTIPVIRLTHGAADTVLVNSQLKALNARWTKQFLTRSNSRITIAR
jgi:hypothetical protein